MKGFDIKNHTVVERILRAERWHVRVAPKFSNKSIMPLAHYNWLLANPAFETVPPGYVIHHLDGNELNDDVSNLALMHRYHHMAYHSKHKPVSGSVKVSFISMRPRDRDRFFPIRKPRINRRYENGGEERWRVIVREKFGEKIKKTCVTGRNGSTFKTYEDAERFVKKIWREP